MEEYTIKSNSELAVFVFFLITWQLVFKCSILQFTVKVEQIVTEPSKKNDVI